MDQVAFVVEVCRRGEAEVVLTHAEGDAQHDGALAGLALCNGKSAHELLVLFEDEERLLGLHPGGTRSEQERRRSKLLQIEWCLDCLAAFEARSGSRSFEWLSWHPSARAVEAAEAILDAPISALAQGSGGGGGI